MNTFHQIKDSMCLTLWLRNQFCSFLQVLKHAVIAMTTDGMCISDAQTKLIEYLSKCKMSFSLVSNVELRKIQIQHVPTLF